MARGQDFLVLFQIEQGVGDHVFEFADVAVPRVQAEGAVQLIGNLNFSAPFCPCVQLDEVAGQQRDVPYPIPQRRNSQFQNIQPMIEVFPEGTPFYAFL